MIRNSRVILRTNLGKLVLTALVIFLGVPVQASGELAPVFSPAILHRDDNGRGSGTATAVQQGRGVESLTGHAALAHLENLRARKHAALEKVVNELTSRGFRPTEHVVVYRSNRSAAPYQQDMGPEASTTITLDEGEVVFWAWDDGDPQTWEGAMYAENYSSGGYLVSEAQVDTTIHQTAWEEVVSYEPGGGGPDDQYSLSGRGAPEAGGFRGGFMQDWLACVVGNCIIAAGGCVFSGPLYLECVVLVCHAVIIGCALSTIIGYL